MARLQPDGTAIAYLKRRFVPPAENFSLLQEHRVTAGGRLDNLAAHYTVIPQSIGAFAMPMALYDRQI